MASGMKLWSTLCLGGLAVAAVLLLPPRSAEQLSFSSARFRNLQPAGNELVRLENEARNANERLKRVRLQDSLDARLAAAVEAGERVVLDFPEGTDAAEAEALRERLAEDLAAAGGRSGDAPVLGLLFVPMDFGSESRTLRRMLSDEYYAGTLDDGTPYCVRVDWIMSDHPSTRSLRRMRDTDGHGPLGMCAYWARFGPPGPQVGAWFASGAYGFGLLGEGHDWYMRFYTRELPFGIASLPSSGSIQRVLASASACVNDGLEHCERMLFDTTAFHATGSGDPDDYRLVYHPTREATDLVASADAVAPPSIARPLLFSELERIEGADAFERFWTSRRPAEEAFAEAVGTRPGEWVRSWLVSVGAARTKGPTLRPKTAGLSFLTLIAAAALGLLIHRRRQVS